jgi:phage N-6-adenine-methyltransferase
MANDLWRTPPEVIDYIQRRFGKIKLDLCASKENAVCLSYLDAEDDFLNSVWLRHNSLIRIGHLAWLNPPYSNPLPFVKQAIKWAEAGYAVAGILNNDPSTKWFVELQKAATFLMPITGGRISFLDGEGKAIKGNNKPQIMFYLAPFGAVSQFTEYVPISEIYPNR